MCVYQTEKEGKHIHDYALDLLYCYLSFVTLALYCHHKEYYFRQLIYTQEMVMSYKGTPLYMGPEIYKGSPYSYKVFYINLQNSLRKCLASIYIDFYFLSSEGVFKQFVKAHLEEIYSKQSRLSNYVSVVHLTCFLKLLPAPW